MTTGRAHSPRRWDDPPSNRFGDSVELADAPPSLVRGGFERDDRTWESWLRDGRSAETLFERLRFVRPPEHADVPGTPGGGTVP